MKELTLNMGRQTPPQKRINSSKSRFNIACFGRQSGKTTHGTARPLRGLNGRRNGVYWYVLQTYSAAEIAFDRFCRMIHPAKTLLTRGKERSTDLTVPMMKGINVAFKSGKNFEDLRIETLDGVIIDEYRQQHPHLWPRVIFPMLGRHNGWADILSTPNGYDHFYDLYTKADNDSTGLWSAFKAPSWEAWWWTPELIQQARGEMSDLEFRQEIGAEFIDMTSGRAYFNFGEHNHRDWTPFGIETQEYVSFLPILVGLDFNLDPMAWILGQHHGDRIHYSEEVHQERSNTPDAAEHLVGKLRRIKKDWNVDLAKHGIILIGDASGKATQRTSNRSDYDIVVERLQREGWRVNNKTPESNPGVRERVNTANAAFKSSLGDIRVTMNKRKCPKTFEDCQRVIWTDASGRELDEGPTGNRTHNSDAATYPIHRLIPLKGARGTVKMTVIQR